MHLPVFGVGISYFSQLDPVLKSNPDLIEILEVEPQTHWFHTRLKADSFRINEKAVSRIKSYKGPKILHGVGCPVGGSRPPDPANSTFNKNDL